MSYLFTSESVSEGHPDKIADQISDALIDNFLAFDKDSKVACETLVTTGQVILAGEVKSNVYLNIQSIACVISLKLGAYNLLFHCKHNQTLYPGHQHLVLQEFLFQLLDLCQTIVHEDRIEFHKNYRQINTHFYCNLFF